MSERFAQRTIIRSGFLIAFIGIVLILLLNSATSSIWLFLPGLFLTGFGAGAMLTASVNVVQSALPDKDQGEISGVSRSVSNLGSSLGTAVAGAVLISALISGISSATANSQVLNADQKQQVTAALQGSVSAVSDAQVKEVLKGQPQAVVDEVVSINAHARDRALGLALAAVSVATLVGFAAALFMPATNKAGSEPEGIT
jgi:predicted MFS family arabinose efflux permease